MELQNALVQNVLLLNLDIHTSPIAWSVMTPATIYAGGKHLFRARDRGTTWEDLGDMTTGVDRSTLPLMGRLPGENILSVDDGVPFYPGLVAIAPSPIQKGLLYVGTDDGRFRMSTDDGRTWTDLQDRLPGAPKPSWFAPSARCGAPTAARNGWRPPASSSRTRRIERCGSAGW